MLGRKLLTGAFLPLRSRENRPFVNGSSVGGRGRGALRLPVSAFLPPTPDPSLPKTPNLEARLKLEFFSCRRLLKAPGLHFLQQQLREVGASPGGPGSRQVRALPGSIPGSCASPRGPGPQGTAAPARPEREEVLVVPRPPLGAAGCWCGWVGGGGRGSPHAAVSSQPRGAKAALASRLGSGHTPAGTQRLPHTRALDPRWEPGLAHRGGAASEKPGLRSAQAASPRWTLQNLLPVQRAFGAT